MVCEETVVINITFEFAKQKTMLAAAISAFDTTAFFFSLRFKVRLYPSLCGILSWSAKRKTSLKVISHKKNLLNLLIVSFLTEFLYVLNFKKP